MLGEQIVNGSAKNARPTGFFTEGLIVSGQPVKTVIIAEIQGEDTTRLAKPIVEEYAGQMGSYLFIPEASPTAAYQGTRENAQGVDLNRSIYDGTPINEALYLQYLFMTFMNPGVNTRVLTLHRDFDPNYKDAFYMYINGDVPEGEIDQVRTDIKALGVPLVTNRLDDPKDPSLGYMIKDGLVHNLVSPPKERGMVEHYLDQHFRTSQGGPVVICPEIPSGVPLKLQHQIVEIVVKHLILGI